MPPMRIQRRGDAVKKLVGYFGVALILLVFVCGFRAYFVKSFDAQILTYFDGFGRQLMDAPIVARYLFGQERLWAGWLWFVGDIVWFFGGIFLGFNLRAMAFPGMTKNQDEAE